MPAPDPTPSHRAVPGRDEFAALAAAFLGQQRSANTRAAYGADLAGFAAWCAASGLDPLAVGSDDVERYRAACESEGASEATIARRLSALSSFFAHAVDEGAVDGTPLEHAHRPPGSRSPTARLTPGEIGALVATSARAGGKTQVLVDLLLFDGLKLGEVLAADASDVTRSDRSGEVALRVTRRRSTTAIELDQRSASAVVRYLAGRTDGPLLLGDSPTRRPARLTRFGADYLLKKAGQEAGIEDPLSANRLRRTFVATAFEAGAPIEAIRDQVGHLDARTTRRHLAGEGGPTLP